MPCLFPTDLLTPHDSLLPGCAPIAPTHILRISFDDPGTPEASRTYVSVEDRLRSWSVDGGRDSELDDYDATTATYVLDNRDRELDPTNAASSFFPDVVPNRLIWHRIEIDSGIYDVFKGYIEGWGPEWPEHGVGDHRANIRATDGRKALRLNTFEAADPDVLDYPDVISVDEPSFYARMGEAEGTKLVHHVRKKRKRRDHESKKHFHKHGFRRWTTRETRSEAEGVSGPAGTYKNTPTLGVSGAIKGDSDTAVLFTRANQEYAQIKLDDVADVLGGEDFSVAAWVLPTSLVTSYIWAGPVDTVVLGGDHTFALYYDGTTVRFAVDDGLGASPATYSTPLSTSAWSYLVGTCDSGNTTLYVNGVSVATSTTAGSVSPSGQTLYIGSSPVSPGTRSTNGKIDEPAYFPKALSAARIAAHYRAAALGFDAASTGERIEDVLALAGVLTPWEIQVGSRSMPPTRYAGEFKRVSCTLSPPMDDMACRSPAALNELRI